MALRRFPLFGQRRERGEVWLRPGDLLDQFDFFRCEARYRPLKPLELAWLEATREYWAPYAETFCFDWSEGDKDWLHTIFPEKFPALPTKQAQVVNAKKAREGPLIRGDTTRTAKSPDGPNPRTSTNH